MSTAEGKTAQHSHFFTEKCSLHGISDIALKQNALLRSFWIFCFSTALAVAFYGIYQVVAQYLLSPLVVSYVVKESDGLTLPDVVLCPFNRFNSSFLKENNVSEDLTLYIEYAFGKPELYDYQQLLSPSFGERDAAELDSMLLRLNTTFSEFIQRASVGCHGFIRYCSHPLIGEYDCCSDALSVMTSLGLCHRIRGQTQFADGLKFGMRIALRIPYEVYTPSPNNLHNDGLMVKLAKRDHGIDFDLVFLPTGFNAILELHATQHDFVNDPPRYSCAVHTQENYSPVSCSDQCLFRSGITACGCSHVASPIPNLPSCKPDRFHNCVVPAVVNHSRLHPNFIDDCREYCQVNCSTWHFASALSMSKIMNPVANDSIVLDVFYKNMEYTLIKHFPAKTRDEFIANLGGQIGLWVGGSILTVLQLVVFLPHSLYVMYRQRRMASKPEPRDRTPDTMRPCPMKPGKYTPMEDQGYGYYCRRL